MAEFWDIYDENCQKTGRTMARGEPVALGDYRLVVHVCILNKQGQMLIQQRQPFKQGWPNYWDLSCGGCALAGDSSQMAAQRELQEELGITHDFSELRPNCTIYFHEGFDDCYIIEAEPQLDQLTLQYEEVQAVKWASYDEICHMIDAGTFIPYRKCFIALLFEGGSGRTV